MTIHLYLHEEINVLYLEEKYVINYKLNLGGLLIVVLMRFSYFGPNYKYRSTRSYYVHTD